MNTEFERDPQQCRRFRTARIAEAIRSCPDLKAGKIVEIEYFDSKPNPRRCEGDMPVYRVLLPGWDADEAVYLYACALADFRT